MQPELVVQRSIIAPGKRAPHDLRLLALTPLYTELTWEQKRNFMGDGSFPRSRALGPAYENMVPELAKQELRRTFGWDEQTLRQECQQFAATHAHGQGVIFHEIEPEMHSEERKHELLSVATATAHDSVMQYEKRKWGDGCKRSDPACFTAPHHLVVDLRVGVRKAECIAQHDPMQEHPKPT